MPTRGLSASCAAVGMQVCTITSATELPEETLYVLAAMVQTASPAAVRPPLPPLSTFTWPAAEFNVPMGSSALLSQLPAFVQPQLSSLSGRDATHFVPLTVIMIRLLCNNALPATQVT